MKIVMGSDHAGFELKNELKALVSSLGHDVHDVGALEYDALDDYPVETLEKMWQTKQRVMKRIIKAKGWNTWWSGKQARR